MPRTINIPLLDLKKEYIFLKKEIKKQIEKCLKSQHWILGEEVKKLEGKISNYLGAKYTIGVASGTDALLLSLRALAIKTKNKEYFESTDEIITTPFTFVATAEAIVRSGARPVFVDINPQTFNIDPENIKKAINKNTIGIIPVHLFGQSAEIEEISQIARENNLFILEDVAQAFGAEFNGKKLGTIGNCGAFSFFPSKNLGSYGDAGMIATNDEKLSDIIKILRVHGQSSQYDAKYIGYNSRLDSMQAAVLLAKFKYIDKFNAARVKIAAKYSEALRKINFIKTPDATPNHIYNLYTIKVPSQLRDKLLTFLNNQGIQARVYYPKALHQMKAFKTAKRIGLLKNAEKAASSVISLPTHPFLGTNEIFYILKVIEHFQ